MTTVVDKRCTICTHEKVSEIERDIVNKVTRQEIQDKYSVSSSALYRHQKNHLPSSIARNIRDMGLVEAVGGNGKDEIVDSGKPVKIVASQLKFLYGRALRTMESCEKADDFQTAIKAQRQALSCLETFFKASEVLYKMSKDSQTDISSANMRKIVLKALDGHEDAKTSVSKALGLAIASGEI